MDITARTPEDAPDFCPVCGNGVAARPSELSADTPCPHCGRLLWFVRKPMDGVVVLSFLPGLITGSESDRRFDEVASAAGDLSRLVVDLSSLRFLSSLFLGMLVTLHKRVVAAQGVLKICGLQPGTREVFTISRLDQMFHIHEDLKAALASPWEPR